MSISDQSFIKQFSSSITCNADGIYYEDSSETISYPESGNDDCFGVEENSFWFRHRNDCIIEMVKNSPPIMNGPIFDIGGGNGFVAKGLMNAGWDTVVVEPGASGARNAKKRGLPHVICATTLTAKFESETIPAIGVFDVVEHIENDVEFLKHLWDLLIPGGMLYLTVPAYQALWSQEDVEGGHFRRYTTQGLKKKLQQTGFSVRYSTYIFAFLPLIIFFLRTLPYRLNLVKRANNNDSIKKDHSSPSGFSGKTLTALMNGELTRIKKRRRIFFGGSCMVAVKKI